ncbi:MAG: Zn-dependent exopeptidase M28 [Clostridia bacterium]|nr:Zn-dependent exopeptidase M28 [Clostridia bacterium]
MKNRISRKTFLIVTVLLVAILTASLLAACSKEPHFDLVKQDGEYGDRVFENMKFLAENYPDRTMCTQGEEDAAKYLCDVLSGWGYTSDFSDGDTVGLQSFKENFTRYDGSAVSDTNAYNVVFTKKARESKGEIILSAQYDNLYGEKNGEELWKADGSYESGSGVALLLTLAESMKDVDYSYDITFAFFSGGSYGWKGAYYYVTQLKNADLDNIKLVLNFSMLGGGDNLYLYTGENASDFGGYLRSASVGLTENPKDKNAVSSIIMETDALYSFLHVGMVGNQYYFANRKIPCANYTSHNWSCNENPFLTEMKGKANVYHTSDDTFATMVGRKGEENVKAMLNDAANSVMNALSADNAQTLDGALETAKEQTHVAGQSNSLSSMATIAVKLIAVAAFFGIALNVRNYIRKNRSQYIKEKVKEEVEIKPFDFDNYPVNENGKGGDSESDNDQNDGLKDPNDPFI